MKNTYKTKSGGLLALRFLNSETTIGHYYEQEVDIRKIGSRCIECVMDEFNRKFHGTADQTEFQNLVLIAQCDI